jgi:hypothetical protein
MHHNFLNNLFFAGVAQLVEQLTCNQQVTSSILVASSKEYLVID